MAPIRVLYLVRSHAIGGLQRLVRLLLCHLPREQFEILFVPYGTGREPDLTFIESLKKLGIPVSSERIPWRGPRDWFTARRAIARLLKDLRIDLVHAHDDQSNMLIGIGRSRWKCACVGSAYGWFEANAYLKLQYAVERRLALPNFDYVYTVSENMRGKLLATGTSTDKVRVIHTGIEQAESATQAERSDMRAKLSLPPDALVIGTLGRLAAEKGHRYLLDAARGLILRYPNLYLLCIGAGSELESLRNHSRKLGIANHVIFPGYVDNIQHALHAMDVFALPSVLDEGFPTVCLEAQMVGLPVVASNVGGTGETLDIDNSGLLVPPGNVEALATALEGLLSDPGRRLQMGDRARSWIRESFSIEKMMGQMAELYQLAHERYREEKFVSSHR